MIIIGIFVFVFFIVIQVVEVQFFGCGKVFLFLGIKFMIVNGRQRQYIFQLFNNYDCNKQYCVVIGYYWCDGFMNDVVSGGFYGFCQLVGDSIIFVVFNGLNVGWVNNGGEDIIFIDQIVIMFKNDFCVNEGEFFVIGWSYGGVMSYSVVCFCFGMYFCFYDEVII